MNYINVQHLVRLNNADIVPFIQVPSVQLETIIIHKLNYPDYYTFCLEGYNGMSDVEKLASNIIISATKNIASLKIEANDKYNGRLNMQARIFNSIY